MIRTAELADKFYEKLEDYSHGTTGLALELFQMWGGFKSRYYKTRALGFGERS